MKREWKPGDVALVGIYRVFAYHDPEDDVLRWMFSDSSGCAVGDDHVQHARPVAVIDPEDREAVERLTKAVVEAADRHGNVVVSGNGIHPDTTADALREFANPQPPKPEEPTGLGAVVEDAEGVRWVRTVAPDRDADHLDKPWSNGLVRCNWQIVTAVRILSAGVES